MRPRVEEEKGMRCGLGACSLSAPIIAICSVFLIFNATKGQLEVYEINKIIADNRNVYSSHCIFSYFLIKCAKFKRCKQRLKAYQTRKLTLSHPVLLLTTSSVTDDTPSLPTDRNLVV